MSTNKLGNLIGLTATIVVASVLAVALWHLLTPTSVHWLTTDQQDRVMGMSLAMVLIGGFSWVMRKIFTME